jgi:hypothetical protein
MMDTVAGLPKRGQTYHGGTPSSITQSAKLEGHEKAFPDEVAGTSGNMNTRRSDRKVYCRLVRNTAGFALLPKRAVTWESGYWGKRVDGYARTTAAAVAGVVDPFLPAAGVADDDLFWLVRKGPCLWKTSLSDYSSDIAEGDWLVALTAATSGATTAGRVGAIDLTGATAVLGGQIINRVGRAMSAKLTTATNADLLVDLELM